MEYNEVLTFWFDELGPAKWWVKDEDVDELIKKRFLAQHEKAMKCELFKWRDSAKGRLAEIIILDQFSRNMFRYTPQSFASDPLALALAQEAVNLGVDNELNTVEKSFLYMPYMHSESLSIHNVALKLYEANGVEANLDFEIKHRDIIVQFGRYPHRNAILDRSSSPEEIEFLTQPNSSF
ncbi:DUF924 domain-containing protein [Vibrio sp. ZSDE26]|uniref:DUF924 domain-containing protein n=1 Tax=Vibrio amylolyticus TaxID=2847292 RepID=A0A9X2BHS2_9VIBR|nr:DUF924 family protein [Vibrio amylolyticus]MCK6264261.1 DUF924 domain-containing protein [Vibrio amylolyticus]